MDLRDYKPCNYPKPAEYGQAPLQWYDTLCPSAYPVSLTNSLDVWRQEDSHLAKDLNRYASTLPIDRVDKLAGFGHVDEVGNY